MNTFKHYIKSNKQNMETTILWADDEIELLKPHILLLEEKGYKVEGVNSGADAIEKCQEKKYDVIFLDENMPGISGLDALPIIKDHDPIVPVVMITKSEEEYIMEEAIGNKIADYLIKPVNTNQIILCLKKILDQSKLVSQKINSNYQQEFRQIGMQLSANMDFDEWKELYAKLVFWDIELESIEDGGMREILEMQKKEANQLFSRYIEKNYLNWLNGVDESPQLLHTLLKNKIIPSTESKKAVVIVIDNLRYDQWKQIEPLFLESFTKEKEDIVFSILPTATQYARNSFFSGLLPSEMAKKFPNLWKNEEDEGGKNMHEKDFLEANLKRLGKNIKWSYNKITNLEAGKKLNNQFNTIKDNDLNFIVYNFVDMLSHARTEMEMIRELASDEAAYRSITLSWFKHSPLSDIVKKVADNNMKLIITTDHGTIRVKNPIKVIGSKSTNSNLRYKVGRGLSYNEKEVFVVNSPQDAFLPQTKLSSEYLFAGSEDFFVYPNNYSHYVNYFTNTFQHGGISLEEMLIPYVELNPKVK